MNVCMSIKYDAYPKVLYMNFYFLNFIQGVMTKSLPKTKFKIKTVSNQMI